jgi:MFS family permease
MWSIYSPLLFFFSAVILVVFLGIITNRKARKNPFNKYIIFLAVPDFCFSFLCAITCLASALNNGYSSWEMCQLQVAYLNFGAAANAWLNGVVCLEVYKLLRSSRIRKRYFPPSDRYVYLSASACFAVALIPALLPLLGQTSEWLPEPGIQAGFVCTVAEQSWKDTLCWWLVIAPLAFAIPYAFASYVFYDVVIRSKLLPPKGKRRELTVYFFR